MDPKRGFSMGGVKPKQLTKPKGRQPNFQKKKKINQRDKNKIPVAYTVQMKGNSRVNRIEKVQDLFIEAVSGSTNFALKQYSINPGIPTSFPSLSLAAARADEYRFRKLRFRFVPTTAVTTTKGMVGLAFDPNPNQGPVGSLQLIQAYEYSIVKSVYADSTILEIPKSALSTWRMVRNDWTSKSLIGIDVGTLSVFSLDMDTSAKVGFIEVDGEIEFRGNQLSSPSYGNTAGVVQYAQGIPLSLADNIYESVDFSSYAHSGSDERLVNETVIYRDYSHPNRENRWLIQLPYGVYKFEYTVSNKSGSGFTAGMAPYWAGKLPINTTESVAITRLSSYEVFTNSYTGNDANMTQTFIAKVDSAQRVWGISAYLNSTVGIGNQIFTAQLTITSLI